MSWAYILIPVDLGTFVVGILMATFIKNAFEEGHYFWDSDEDESSDTMRLNSVKFKTFFFVNFFLVLTVLFIYVYLQNICIIALCCVSVSFCWSNSLLSFLEKLHHLYQVWFSIVKNRSHKWKLFWLFQKRYQNEWLKERESSLMLSVQKFSCSFAWIMQKSVDVWEVLGQTKTKKSIFVPFLLK